MPLSISYYSSQPRKLHLLQQDPHYSISCDPFCFCWWAKLYTFRNMSVQGALYLFNDRPMEGKGIHLWALKITVSSRTTNNFVWLLNFSVASVLDTWLEESFVGYFFVFFFCYFVSDSSFSTGIMLTHM